MMADWLTSPLSPDWLCALRDFCGQFGDWSHWQSHGFYLATRWGVLWFLAVIPLVWVFEFLAPRRWWLVFLSILSLAFIAFGLMPWPMDGVFPEQVAHHGGHAMTWARRAMYGLLHAAIVVLLLVGVYRLARTGERRCREAGRNPWHPLVAAVLFLIVGYFVLYGIRSGWRRLGEGAYSLDAFIILPNFHEAGLAYIFVKSVHYVWDSCRGRIQNRSWWRFLCWMTFFPSFRVGPIERYHDFFTQVQRCHRRFRASDLLHGLRRIVQGALKGVLCLFLSNQWLPAVGNELADTVATSGASSVPYLTVWMLPWMVLMTAYLALAGYTDIAIGLARLMGYRMAENFNWMFFSHNLSELWRRTHMTMSRCLRDYCYYPLVRRGPFRRRPLPGGPAGQQVGRLLLPTVNFYITFVFCGLWHAPVSKMILWGLLFGTGMAVFELWVWFWQQRVDHNGLLYRGLARTGLAGGGWPQRVLGVLLTIHFLALSVLLFHGPELFFVVTRELIHRPFTWLF